MQGSLLWTTQLCSVGEENCWSLLELKCVQVGMFLRRANLGRIKLPLKKNLQRCPDQRSALSFDKNIYLDEQISFKEKRRQQAESVRN
jgi:hypothetical protein